MSIIKTTAIYSVDEYENEFFTPKKLLLRKRSNDYVDFIIEGVPSYNTSKIVDFISALNSIGVLLREGEEEDKTFYFGCKFGFRVGRRDFPLDFDPENIKVKGTLPIRIERGVRNRDQIFLILHSESQFFTIASIIEAIIYLELIEPESRSPIVDYGRIILPGQDNGLVKKRHINTVEKLSLEYCI